MSRGDGFQIADVNVGLLDDPKLRALVRLTRDDATVTRCVVAYIATVLGSWEHGERVAVDDAAPLWLTAVDDARARLAEVDLLDEDGRIPDTAWANYFGPADERRKKNRDRWTEWKKRRETDVFGSNGGATVSSALADDPQRVADESLRVDQRAQAGAPTVPFLPSRSGPAGPSAPTDGARETPESTNPPPPFGEPGVRIEITEAVFQAIEARGLRVDRTNGHARMLRELVAAHGVAAVLMTIGSIDATVASAGDVAKLVGDSLRPRPRAQRASPEPDPVAVLTMEERAARTRAQLDPRQRAALAAANGDQP